jgi:hypothetical protein
LHTLNIITTFNSDNKKYNFEEALRNKEIFHGADDRQAIVGEVPAESVPPAASACALISSSNINTNLLYRDTLLPTEVIIEVLVVEAVPLIIS